MELGSGDSLINNNSVKLFVTSFVIFNKSLNLITMFFYLQEDIIDRETSIDSLRASTQVCSIVCNSSIFLLYITYGALYKLLVLSIVGYIDISNVTCVFIPK